ncbi:MAG: hypothetical protein WHS44_09890 [Fimbriimonadales bacterium]|nr:MAG: hypothetical protein KatS3mg018_0164 [Fimbriimonadales bacterium]
MAITITATENAPIPTGEYRVELTAIELADGQYGQQLRWTFAVLDYGKTLIAYSSVAPSLKSKAMRWAAALLGRAIKPGESVNFDALVGKTAIATVVRKRKDDGTEYNAVDDLHADDSDADPFE